MTSLLARLFSASMLGLVIVFAGCGGSDTPDAATGPPPELATPDDGVPAMEQPPLTVD